jgi:predicted transcriptional regulator
VNRFGHPYSPTVNLEMVMEDQKTDLLDLTAHIVANYVGNNSASVSDLPALIKSVHGALAGVSAPEAAPAEQKSPAVPIKRSITPDAIICLEDGRKFKSLKRHLRTKYNLSPEEYRAKWGLPKDYPMVAPSYAEARSALAKSMGLRQGGRRPAAAVVPPTRGRKPKAAAGA